MILNSKRLFTLLTAGLLLGIGIGVTTLLNARPAIAVPPCAPGDCPAGTPYRTVTVHGTGADCTAALNSARSQALVAALSGCSSSPLTCRDSFVQEGACFTNSQGLKQVNGHATYNCASCIPLNFCV